MEIILLIIIIGISTFAGYRMGLTFKQMFRENFKHHDKMSDEELLFVLKIMLKDIK
jgi:hypothetical protein